MEIFLKASLGHEGSSPTPHKLCHWRMSNLATTSRSLTWGKLPPFPVGSCLCSCTNLNIDPMRGSGSLLVWRKIYVVSMWLFQLQVNQMLKTGRVFETWNRRKCFTVFLWLHVASKTSCHFYTNTKLAF